MYARSDRQDRKVELNFSLEAAESKAASRAWLITFTDLVSLLLTFFVMLFAMSNVKLDEWESITDSLTQTLRPNLEQADKPITSAFNIGTIFRQQAIDLNYLSSILEEKIRMTETLEGTRLQLLEDRLIVRLPSDLLFIEGEAELKDSARQPLFDLAGVFQNIGNQIGVGGHSAENASVGGAYASNWELSAARAISVANALASVGYRDKITAYGYADSRMAGQVGASRIEIVIAQAVRTTN